jgi:hypothetical protein
MIWIPCSYCSFVAFSPTLAKWAFIVMTEGAVDCLTLGSRRSRTGDDVEDIIIYGVEFPIGENEMMS